MLNPETPRQQLEDQIWQESNNDPALFNLLLRRHDTERYLEALSPEHAEARQVVGADLAEIEASISGYGEPVNEVDQRLSPMRGRRTTGIIIPAEQVREAHLVNPNR